MKFSLASPLEISSEIGHRVRLARIARRMTQPELAKRVGVSVGTIRNLELTGDCAFSTVVKVALALRLEEGLEGLFKLGTESIDDLIQIDRARKVMRRGPRELDRRWP